jgi:hypothetical protein
MTSWCSSEDVALRVRGDVPAELLQEVADRSTSLLYTLSGRRFKGRKRVTVDVEIDSRGYVKLNPWVPVRQIISSSVPVALSPGGTYAAVPRTGATNLYGPQGWGAGLASAVVTMTIEYGEDPPASGRDAAAALAAHMLRADPRYLELVQGTEAQEDVLPASHITSITRQGVTYSFADRAALAREEQTGVYEVDLFLRAANPNGMRHQPKVVAP